jgi:precorrin-6Y C5,15-methyltransferase (decarboxylating)
MPGPPQKTAGMDGALGRVPEWIRGARAAGRSVAVLATGDPLCHGIASLALIGKLGAGASRCCRRRVDAATGLRPLQKRPGRTAKIASCHSRRCRRMEPSARRPEHGLYPVLRADRRCTAGGVFTSPENSPERMARALLAAGHGDEAAPVGGLPPAACRTSSVCSADADCRRPPADASFPSRTSSLSNASPARPAPPASAATTSNTGSSARRRRADHQAGGARAVAGQAAPAARQPVWDIGAGSGSVGLEARDWRRHGHVWAIEKNAADAANARANARRLRASNYTLVEGKAPAGLDAWPDPDAVFIGGSGGELAELIRLVLDPPAPGGRLVMNFVTLENLATATAALAAAGAAWDVVQLQASRSQPILDMHRLAAQNPVWIVTARKKEPP